MNDYTSPQWAHSALLTIDVQRDFTLSGGVLPIPGTIEVLPAMQRLLTTYRKSELPIVHIVRLYLQDGSNADLCRRGQIENGATMAVPGTNGSQLVDELLPAPGIRLDPDLLLSGERQQIGPNEWVLYKSRFGAFFQTRLNEYLREMGVTTVVVSGCNFPNCPRTTMYEASERDFRIVAIIDAISGIYERGREELKGIGVHLATADECVEAIQALQGKN
jgi:nicotinamidase-related amidase